MKNSYILDSFIWKWQSKTLNSHRVLHIFSPSTPIFKWWAHFHLIGLSKDIYNFYIGQLALKLQDAKVLRALKNIHFTTWITVHKTIFIFARWIFTTCYFWASLSREKLYALLKTPITGKFTQYLQMEVTVFSEANQF